MKKALCILTALMMAVTFSGSVFAQTADPLCKDCPKTQILNLKVPGSDQGGRMCPFDYENPTYYIDDDNDGKWDKAENAWCYDEDSDKIVQEQIVPVNNRVIVDICACEKENKFKGHIQLDSALGVYMEIVTPGVYFAEDVSAGIRFQLYPKTPTNNWCNGNAQPRIFPNVDIYQQDGTTPAVPLEQCTTFLANANKARKIVTPNIASAYTITQADIDANACNMWLDIPKMIINPAEFKTSQIGQTIQIKVGVFNDWEDPQYLCQDIGNLMCVCTIDIARFGCEDAAQNFSMLFPYFTEDGPATAYWSGIAISNLTSKVGTATLNIYESDGDMGTATIQVKGNSVEAFLLRSIPDVKVTPGPGEGVLFDSRCYIRVDTDFNADGFAMISDNNDNGTSMGYLPRLED